MILRSFAAFFFDTGNYEKGFPNGGVCPNGESHKLPLKQKVSDLDKSSHIFAQEDGIRKHKELLNADGYR
ncbi:hypothetical protein [Prevotella sp. HUN102]|uniref:hypothetical protein n=1 Tax=Prevotella sp. HUN102 TaxID=1392486 RepID=UPI000AD491AF|nr:hypothetical protein [Prevotella sp. HUN102]